MDVQSLEQRREVDFEILRLEEVVLFVLVCDQFDGGVQLEVGEVGVLLGSLFEPLLAQVGIVEGEFTKVL